MNDIAVLCTSSPLPVFRSSPSLMLNHPSSETLLPSRINLAIQSLPYLTLDDLNDASKDCCPICFVPFTTILARGGDGMVTSLDDPDAVLNEKDVENDEKACRDTRSEVGVTKLNECGHMFCRKDLAQWMRRLKGSCPTCRHIFLDIRPYDHRQPYDARPVRITRRWSRSRLYFNDIEIGVEVDVDTMQDDSDSELGDESAWTIWEYDTDEEMHPLTVDVFGGDDNGDMDVDTNFYPEDGSPRNPTDDQWVDAPEVRVLEVVHPTTPSTSLRTIPLRSSPLRMSWLPS